ncbi:MAG: aminopeptidase P N-terminal domain-containing protein [Gemmatimonadaceae bacterium]|nr:aminopeptidase P N-terminal domain-containing protein [Gemmatimonadaceae bacterium]
MKKTTRQFIAPTLLLLATVTPELAAQISATEYTARRTALAQGIPNGILVALGSPAPSEDFLWFYQNSPFKYLTGFDEPEAALVMVVRDGAIAGKPLIFVQPKDPSREVWEGTRLGVDGARSAFGFDARVNTTLPAVIDSLLGSGAGRTLHVVGDYRPDREIRSHDDQFVAAVARRNPGITVQSANAKLNTVRGVKSAVEQDLLRKSIAITVDAHREAMRLVEPGMNEFELQALIEYTFRRNGADRPSFVSIVGSGPNSTTLHYGADDRFIENGDVIVMDIGASYRGYAADVTRTVPANGTFTPAQREIYQAVRDAQAAAERAAAVNGPAGVLSEVARASLRTSLVKFGLIESADATYDCDAAASRQCTQLSLYYMHGLGHGIGLDVHDPGSATGSGNLVPGSAFTIEPGIYVRGNLLDIIPRTPRNQAMIGKIRRAVEKYRNIGVRIEDDYIVTPTAVEWVSRAPREIAEIEAIMRQPWTGPAPRDRSKVEWYRSTGRPAP